MVLTGLSNFTAAKDSVEWSLTVRDWPFQKTANSLLLDFSLSHFSDASKGQYVIDAVEFVAHELTNSYTLRAVGNSSSNASLTSDLMVNLTIPLVATIDGKARQIQAPVLTTASALASLLQGSSAAPVSSLQSAQGDRVDTIAFVFPSFNKSLTYDPNLGLLLTGKQHAAFLAEGMNWLILHNLSHLPPGKEKGGSSDDHTLLIVLTTVLVSCAVLVVAAAVIGTFVAMKIKASRTISQDQCVQLHPDGDALDHDAL